MKTVLDDIDAMKAKWEREAIAPTPLPWRVVRGLQWNDKDELVAISGAPPNEDTVADNMEYYPHAIKAADAEFIVARVNAHDALVAALKEAQSQIRLLGLRASVPVSTDYIDNVLNMASSDKA